MNDDTQVRLELENRQRALAELHHALVEAERRVVSADERLERVEQDHAVELAARHETQRRLEERIARLEHELRVAVHERNTFEWERDRMRAERDAANAALDAIRRSRSYRWAEALRQRARPGGPEGASP